ncbi:MAG: hypothetical protein AAFX09_13085 [Pseudomonadota bacterium]
MSRAVVFDVSKLGPVLGAFACAAAIAFAAAAPADAQRNRGDQEQEDTVNRTLSADVGEAVQRALELQDADQFAESLEVLRPLFSQEITPYERQIAHQLSAQANFNLDRLDAAIRDFLGALGTGTMVPDEAQTMRVNVGQLYMATDNIPAGIQQFEIAIREGAELTPRLAKMLSQAYAQAERYRDGLRYAEQFYRATPNSEKSSGDFSLMQHYYNMLNRPADELRVVREMLVRFPGERRSWQNFVSLVARTGQEEEAFEANKLMYLNGLFAESAELERLAQYYSYFENPYRGASILEREINAGRVDRNVDNIELLANMWRQAAEFDRALPVLEQLYNLTSRGNDALKLAEAHYEVNRFSEAEQWFETALDRGGLDAPGAAWTLLGDVRLKLDNRSGALQAFEQGTRFPDSRRTARNWVDWVNTQIRLERDRARQREQVLVDECRLTLEAERRLLVLTGEVDEEGNVRFTSIPDRCQPYFDIYGEQIREAGQG